MSWVGGKGLFIWHWISDGHDTSLSAPYYIYFKCGARAEAMNERLF